MVVTRWGSIWAIKPCRAYDTTTGALRAIVPFLTQQTSFCKITDATVGVKCACRAGELIF